MKSSKTLRIIMALFLILLMTGVSAAQLAIDSELDGILDHVMREEGIDPTEEDVAEARDAVLLELQAEYGEENVLAAIKEDPLTVVARISARLEITVGDDGEEDPTKDESGSEPPTDDEPEEPIEPDDELPPGDEPEEPIDEGQEDKEGGEKRAPRARAIERLKEHLERGLPVENALAAVTKEKHRALWAEKGKAEQGAEDGENAAEDGDDLPEPPIGDEDQSRDDDDRDASETDEEESTTSVRKEERSRAKLQAKEEKEEAKRERKAEKEREKKSKQDRKQERNKNGKANKN